VPPRRAHALDRWLGRLVAARLAVVPLRVRLWDDAPLGIEPPRPLGTLTVRTRGRLWRIALDPAVALGDGYVDGTLALEGALVPILEAANRAAAPDGRLPRARRRSPGRIDVAAARRNARRHYDLGNDFFRLWLDDDLVYTCAYFDDPQATLAQAQRAKLDYVCRKLALQGGEHVVEAGCGWGALAIHMAEHWGARVRAFNVSPAQLDWARAEVARRGLARRVELIEDDWRAISGRYDAFVSVGMLEAVGPASYAELGAVIRRSLGAGGRGLVHSIGRHQPHAADRWIDRHVFPGTYLPSLGEMTAIFEPNGLAVTDVENLRGHYARTMALWLERFEAAAPEVEAMFDDDFVRRWRLYLSSALAAFRAGWLQLYQVVVEDAASAATARTRRRLYATADDRPLREAVTTRERA